MAKRERNKRSARKARQQERQRVAEAQAIAASNAKGGKVAKAKAKKSRAASSKLAAVPKGDRKGIQKVTGYFADVRYEMHQVAWPSRRELRNYSVAVIVMLILFGIAIWAIDTGFVAGLVQYTSLRG